MNDPPIEFVTFDNALKLCDYGDFYPNSIVEDITGWGIVPAFLLLDGQQG
jgi:hypothetical protein